MYVKKTDLMKAGRKIGLYVVLALLLMWALGPIYWIFISSISSRIELYIAPLKHWIPHQPTLQNYKDIFISGTRYKASVSIPSTEIVLKGIRNSLVLSFGSAIILSLLAFITGYSFSRFNFRGKNFLFIFVLAMMPLPIWISLITLYMMISALNMVDSLPGMILVFVAYGIPLYTWLMRTYLESVPVELEDAARVDGCSRFRTMFQITLPIVRPGLTSVFLVAFLTTWGNFWVPLIFSDTPKSQPLTVVLSLFIGQFNVAWNALATAVVLTIVPLLFIAFFFQRYLVRGLTMGAIKE
jgi:multiple sugar transport system permease protein